MGSTAANGAAGIASAEVTAALAAWRSWSRRSCQKPRLIISTTSAAITIVSTIQRGLRMKPYRVTGLDRTGGGGSRWCQEMESDEAVDTSGTFSEATLAAVERRSRGP